MRDPSSRPCGRGLPWYLRPPLRTRDLAGRPEDAPLETIELRGVGRSFEIGDRRVAALEDVTLRIGEREIVAVVGPNGCGKSTLLRLMSGLLAPDHGQIRVFGSPVTTVHPRIGLVFQEPRLLPWRDVLANVALPLELAGIARAEREARAHEMLSLTGLTDFGDAYPEQLSGGMAQRAALARALATGPDVLLLDEPFSALDAMTRERLDAELVSLWARTGKTIVLVTHSITEAVFVADRVLVMTPRPGRIAADVPVTDARPRRHEGSGSAAASEAATLVRAALTGDPTRVERQEAAA